MKLLRTQFAALALLAALPWTFAAAAPPAAALDLRAPWVRAAPAEVEMDAALLDAAAVRLQAIPRARSLLVARRGRLVVERYFGVDGTGVFDVRSVTKSVVSALTGIAVRAGRLGLDDSIAGHLSPPYLLDGADAAITPRHLLTMTSGFHWEENSGSGLDYNNWILNREHVQYLLDRPHVAAPGAQFEYNSAAVHVLGAVLERATGMPLPLYAQEQLFGPLAIEPVQWEALEAGMVNGGSGIKLRGPDLLKLGQLYLQRGFSGETSIVPEDWVAESALPQFPWRNRFGSQRGISYGLLWWTSDVEPAAFFAWGYGGQFIYVVPSLELVAVATTDWRQTTASEGSQLAQQVLSVIVDSVAPAAR